MNPGIRYQECWPRSTDLEILIDVGHWLGTNRRHPQTFCYGMGSVFTGWHPRSVGQLTMSHSTDK